MIAQADSSADEFFKTRASLLSRLRNVEDSRSWVEFFDLYWKLIHNIATQSGVTATEAQDVVQVVFVDLARKLPEFKYDAAQGSFKQFLKTLVKWRVRDQLRKRSKNTPLHDVLEDDPSLSSPNPLDALWDAEWERNLVDAAMERIRARVDPRQYQIFDLAKTREMAASDIAKLLKTNVAGVYIAKHRIAAKIKSEIKELKAKYERNLTQSEKESF